MAGPPDIPPDLRSRLNGLRLTTRRAGGDRGIGAHASRSRGSGLEFAQYRAYEPGDEPRQIDWKLYARSDRLFVREAERDSPLTLWMLIDASGSMGQADRARPDWSRLDAAKMLAACLAELALRQDDRFGWAVLGGERAVIVDPGRGRRQRDRLRIALGSLPAEGGFPDAATLRPVRDRIGAHDLTVLLSDCFDEGCVALVEALASAGREVLVIQLLTAEERDFPFSGGFRFNEPESGAEIVGDGQALRADYLRRFAAARATLHGRLEAVGVRHATGWTDAALDAPLRALFGRPGRAG